MHFLVAPGYTRTYKRCMHGPVAQSCASRDPCEKQGGPPMSTIYDPLLYVRLPKTDAPTMITVAGRVIAHRPTRKVPQPVRAALERIAAVLALLKAAWNSRAHPEEAADPRRALHEVLIAWSALH